MKKLMLTVFCLFALIVVQTFAEDIEITVKATQPEYVAQDRQIWDIFEEENPGIKIKLISINEPEEAAYHAKIAAGDPAADLSCWEAIDKDNYQFYVNWLELDYPYWDIFLYDARKLFEKYEGIAGVQPYLQPFSGPTFTFIYNVDEMKKAGEDPKHSIKTLDDLRALFGRLKTYVDKTPDKDIVLDKGWIARGVMENWAANAAYSQGGYLEQQQAVYLGEIRWNDAGKNPFALYFKLYKEFYDNGWLPDRWWLRNWETDFEASFIARKSMLAFHGPWLWDKVLAADPTANLDGFPWPAGPNGKCWTRPADRNGTAIPKVSMEKPYWEEIKKAAFWWNSPQVIKWRVESYAQGMPMVDLNSIGGADIQSPQYIKVLKPFSEGFWWDWKWDNGLLGEVAAAPYQKSGAAQVMRDNANATNVGEYYEGKITLNELLSRLQKRWDVAYPELVEKQKAK